MNDAFKAGYQVGNYDYWRAVAATIVPIAIVIVFAYLSKRFERWVFQLSHHHTGGSR